MTSIMLFACAAVAEIEGCFAFWSWSRLGRSVWWLLPGSAALLVFALLLTLADTPFAGRAYAAYGAIYVVMSLVWLRVVEGVSPDRWDMLGGVMVVAGAALILLGPRSS